MREQVSDNEQPTKEKGNDGSWDTPPVWTTRWVALRDHRLPLCHSATYHNPRVQGRTRCASVTRVSSVSLPTAPSLWAP